MHKKLPEGVSEQRTVGGKSVDVLIAPRDFEAGHESFVERMVHAFSSLASGMKLTLGYLLRPSTVVTQQYPENKSTLKMQERFRGQLRLTKDENDIIRCNGCNFCGLACPNKSIVIKDKKNSISGTSEIDQFVWRLDTCTFCNACIQACPHDALEWSSDFEAAVLDRRLLVYGLNTYSGPPSAVMKRAEKKQENVEELKATAETRDRYEGQVPMAGADLPGMPGLPTRKTEES
jgi:NADH-quinone oxidoreductase subunit I